MKWYLVVLTLSLALLAAVSIIPLFGMGSIGFPVADDIASRSQGRLHTIQDALSSWYQELASSSGALSTGSALNDEAADRERLEALAAEVDLLSADMSVWEYQTRNMSLGFQVFAAFAVSIALLIAVFLWLVTVRGISQPVQALAVALEQVDRLEAQDEQLEAQLRPRGLSEIKQVYASYNALAQRLNDYRSRIQEAERQTMSRFIVHEVRNGITPISLGLQTLQSQAAGPSSERALRVMSASLTSMERLLEQLKTLYSPATLRPQLCFPVRLASDCPAAADARLSIIGGDDVMAWADSAVLSIVLDNLLRNALQALDSVQAAGGVYLVVAQMATYCQILIADDGPGIDAQDADKLFTEYFTSKKNGSGLGLAFSRRLARQMNGDLRVYDTDAGWPVSVGGQRPSGACFELCVPAAAASSTPLKDV